jgi:hypothetical protein
MTFRSKALLLLTLSAALTGSGCGNSTIQTPLEQAEADVLTSHEDMVAFLRHLQEETGAYSMEAVGTSVQGRDILLLHFGTDQDVAQGDDRLKVLIFTQQHGNEHSGMQAAITLTRDIAQGAFAEFQHGVDFYLIPQVNPDGSELKQRRNAEDFDLNRDHLPLYTPEVQTVHRVFQEVMPHVVLDVHEYGIASSSWVEKGLHKSFGQQIDGLTNANMPLELRAYAIDNVVATMRDALVSRDVDLHRYLVTNGPDARFRHSTAALNDGRNSAGIYNALTFLIEGKNGMTVEDNIRERARKQMETMKAFLNYFGEHSAEVKGMVEGYQAELAGANPPEDVALVMDYVKDPANPTVTVGVVEIETGIETELVIEEYYPVVEATLHVKRPVGYFINEDHEDILGVLERHGVEMIRLEDDVTTQGETYAIRGFTEIEKEDKGFLDVQVMMIRGEAYGHPGDYWVPVQGIQSNLIVSILEPQSQWGLGQLPEFRHLLEEMKPWPVRRVMEMWN